MWARGTHVSRHQVPKDLSERVGSYCGMAAQRGIAHIWGAPPGMGSKVQHRHGARSMFIDYRSNIPDENNLPSENVAALRYLEHEFSDHIKLNEEGYMDYSVFHYVDFQAPPWATERGRFTSNPQATFLRLPSGMDVGSLNRRTFHDPVVDTHASVTGHRYVMPKMAVERIEQQGAIVHVRLRDAPTDTSLFVDRLGRTSLLTRDNPHSSWAVPSTLAVQRTRHAGGGNWEMVPGAVTMVTDGIIERVKPQWYW